ncbi:MAG: GNAT family N-acetyltransferase [Candidatus Acidiferrales bacterium]
MNTLLHHCSGTAMDSYVTWLKNSTSIALFESGGVWWRPYHRALVPASPKPEPVALREREAQELLQESGMLFLRYFTRTFDEPTAFWYTVCREYGFDELSRDMRRKIRRARERCEVRQVDADWMATHAYGCYAAAFRRYANAWPDSRETFEKTCREAAGGPFEFWGAFVDGALAAFTKVVTGEDYAAAVVTKLHPDFLPYRPGYALRDSILTTYVAGQGKPVTDGFRSVAHETQQHDHLMKFGYQRVFCDLRIVYRPAVRRFVRFCYPFRSWVDRIPANARMAQVRSLLMQEQIRRSFQ